MKLTAITCVSLFALFGACEKKASAGGSPPPSNAPGPITTDAELERRVRQAIMDDNMLSPTVTGLSVTAANGVVTLRGAVKTPKDKDAIAAKARGVPGVNNVTNDITVG
jgi:osmotically-inducible protein OsmY